MSIQIVGLEQSFLPGGNINLRTFSITISSRRAVLFHSFKTHCTRLAVKALFRAPLVRNEQKKTVLPEDPHDAKTDMYLAEKFVLTVALHLT